MKTSLLIIFAFAGLFLLFSQNSDALIMINDPANTTDVIVVGTIVSVFPNYDKLETEYEVSIEDIVKGESLLSHGNYTKTLHFTSPGIADSEIKLRRTPDYKLFEEGQRALFLLYEKNDKLVHGLSVVNSFCNAEQMMQLYYVPAGLVMTQDGIDEQPYHTHEPITAQFYYFNKNLDESTIDVNIKIVDDFPDVLREETSTLNLEICQAYAVAETQFVIEKPGKFAISVDVDGGNGGGMAISGIDVIDYFQSPLKQFNSGIPIYEITCKENLALIQKHDGSPACVKPSSIPDLIKRNWTTTKVLLDMPLAQLGKECGHYSHNEFFSRMQNHTLDTLCHDFIVEKALDDEKKMLEQGYLFDVKEQVWKKNGFPDTMMSISYHYMMNLEAENED